MPGIPGILAGIVGMFPGGRVRAIEKVLITPGGPCGIVPPKFIGTGAGIRPTFAI